MFQDPDLLANILIVVIFALALVPFYLAGRFYARHLKRLRKLCQEPETHGDDGGRPAPLYDVTPCRPDTPAPQIGCGLLAGNEWPDGPKGLSAHGYRKADQ